MYAYRGVGPSSHALSRLKWSVIRFAVEVSFLSSLFSFPPTRPNSAKGCGACRPRRCIRAFPASRGERGGGRERGSPTNKPPESHGPAAVRLQSILHKWQLTKSTNPIPKCDRCSSTKYDDKRHGKSRPLWRTAVTCRSIPPAKSGRRDGCTFRHRPAHRRQNPADRIRMYPTQSTSCVPASSSALVTSSSNSSRSRPFFNCLNWFWCWCSFPVLCFLSMMTGTLIVCVSVAKAENGGAKR